MYILHFTLNTMSMMALALMIDILVDDSIVVLQNIYRHLHDLERAQQAIIARPKTSFMSRLAPGVIARPAKYLGTVDSSSGSSSSGDPLAAIAMLDLKQGMDRYEAALLLGLALLVGSAAGWPAHSLTSRGSGWGTPELHRQRSGAIHRRGRRAVLLRAALKRLQSAAARLASSGSTPYIGQKTVPEFDALCARVGYVLRDRIRE